MNQEKQRLEEIMLSSEKKYDGALLHIFRDTVQLPNGKSSVREYNRHVGAVCVLPLDRDGSVILERQYRYPIGDVLLEIPAGKLNSKDEDPEEAGRRELEEETGIHAGKMTFLGFFYPAPAYSDEKIHMYLAEDLTQSKPHLDADEFLDVIRMPFSELIREIDAGRVADIKTQAAALRVKLRKESL